MSYKITNNKNFIDNLSRDTAIRRNEARKSSFNDVFQNELNKKEGVTISNHAAERLKDRDIHLDETDMEKINEGINLASDKGCRECVIFYKDAALVTSIKNRTIITAMDKENSRGNIFTNVDSVLLL